MRQVLTKEALSLRKRKRHCLNGLRKAFRLSDTYQQALEQCKEGPKYRCAHCRMLVTKSKCEIDHIVPVSAGYKPQHELTDLEMVSRLFCSLDNLQVLCKDCHKTKTTSDRKRK